MIDVPQVSLTPLESGEHTPPIRVTIRPSVESSSPLPLPDRFWQPLRKTPPYEGRSIASLEGQLLREFGDRLKARMIASVEERLRQLEQCAWQDSVRVQPQQQSKSEAAQRAQTLPEYRELVQTRNALVVAKFAVRIQGYSSLELLVFGLQQALNAFFNNFDLFEAMVMALVPEAFADVFTQEFADLMRYDIFIPPAYASLTGTVTSGLQLAEATSVANQQPAARTLAQRQADLLQRLASGSWLLPVLLSIVVLFLAIYLFETSRNAQYDALNPILEHQRELLKEDRERLATSRVLEQAVIQNWLQQTGAITQPLSLTAPTATSSPMVTPSASP